MKIGIVGCGWLGIKIAEELKIENEIYVTSSSKSKELILQEKDFHPTIILFSEEECSKNSAVWNVISELDLVIITIPFSKKSTIFSLENKLFNLCEFIGEFKKQIFLMSSVGIYPQLELTMSETSLTRDVLQERILFGEEYMKSKYPHVNILRLGGLMGDDRVFSKYAITTPAQIVNHVHYDDICGVIKRMIELECHGKCYNVVAPLHPTKGEIINSQKNEIVFDEIGESYGRNIISNLLESELDYQFIRPNPLYFNEK